MAGTCGALMLFLLPRTLRWERVRDGRGLGAPPDGWLRCSVHMRVVQIYVVLTNAWNQLDLSRVWRPVAWVVGARGSWASGVARGTVGVLASRARIKWAWPQGASLSRKVCGARNIR